MKDRTQLFEFFHSFGGTSVRGSSHKSGFRSNFQWEVAVAFNGRDVGARATCGNGVSPHSTDRPFGLLRASSILKFHFTG